MKTLTVNTPTGQYNILIKDGLLVEVGSHVQALRFKGRCAVVTNPDIGSRYADLVLKSLQQNGFSPTLCEIPEGEQHKNIQTLSSLYDQFFAADLDRNCLILALGGGVLGDLAGFAAASFMRGLPFIQIPTTLLAMVDSSVGGKTGIDLPQGKNLVGAFKQPEMVLIDPQVLKTLPEPEFRSGLAEVLKHGIVAAPHLFAALEQEAYTLDWLLAEAIQVKIDIVEEDPFERGRRAVLNLGHTFGHAFEKLSHFQLRHGEGVAMGIACAAQLAVNLGYCNQTTADRIFALIKQVHLPTRHPGFPPDLIWQAMGADKKKEAGKLRFILPRRMGEVDIFSDVPEEAVKAVLH